VIHQSDFKNDKNATNAHQIVINNNTFEDNKLEKVVRMMIWKRKESQRKVCLTTSRPFFYTFLAFRHKTIDHQSYLYFLNVSK
jgi:hypothetical protein